jgi:ATP-binding cassette subfamily B protein
LLVLDDCLSAVDTETEERILSHLKTESNNLTTVIVSHRISSIRNADRILVIDNGESIEEGTHEELMERNGHYALLYKQQLAEDQAKDSNYKLEE